MAKKENTFEPDTLIPRGIYIREFERGSVARSTEYFAEQADKERELRLTLGKPKNWLSQYFGKEPDKEELHEFFTELIHHMAADYDMSEIDDWVQCNLK